MKNIVDISAYIESIYKEYSMAALKRSIPHLIDGLKESQRKILYTAKIYGNKIDKTLVLVGRVTSTTKYAHGDSSLGGAINTMAQDYTGSNNYPLLDYEGSMGNKFGDKPASPRYTSVKSSKYLDLIFNNEDTPILNKNIDLEYPEPEYYVPIIPYVLLNGISGTGVGYACEIPSYNPIDIIDNIEYIIEDKLNRVDIRPFYKGYTGDIVNENNKWVIKGKYERINTTTIKISEVPIGTNLEKYKEILNKLIDDGMIKDYDDLSDSQWCIVIRATREFVSRSDEELTQIFKLKQNINSNINVLYNNEIVTYDNPINIVEDFVKIRLEYYEKRKKYILDNYLIDICKNYIKKLTNIYINSNNIKNFDKNEIKEYVIPNFSKILDFFNNESIELLKNIDIEELINNVITNIKLTDIFNNKIKEIENKIKELVKEFYILKETEVKKIYKKELKELKKHLLI